MNLFRKSNKKKNADLSNRKKSKSSRKLSGHIRTYSRNADDDEQSIFRLLFDVRCLLSQVNGEFKEIHTLQHVPTSGNRLTAEPSGKQKHKTILALFSWPNSTTPDNDDGTQAGRKRERGRSKI